MITFALDCHSQTAGVAVLKDNALLYECTFASQSTHSETLLKLCDDAFNTVNLKPFDINLFAVTNGPGSFTGIRIGLSIIKAMAFANNTPCVGVSSLKALANSLPINGYIAACIDARRDEIYCALFKKENGVITQIIEDDALSCDNFSLITKQKTESGAIVTAIGDGAKKLCNSHKNFIMSEDVYIMGRASSIAKLATEDYNNNKAISSNKLMPSYLKLSQAERQMQNKEFK